MEKKEKFLAKEIIKFYNQFRARRGDFRKFLSNKNPETSKYWKFFIEAAKNFVNDVTFDPYIFIEAQFIDLPEDKIIYPAQLKTKAAVKKYQEHRESLKIREVDSEEDTIINNLIATFKFLKKWWKKNNLPIDSYDSFFKPKKGEIISEGFWYVIQRMVSKYYIAISKSFKRYYDELDIDAKYEIISPEELKHYKINIKLNYNAYKFAKNLFKGDIE